jgi:hypothetical protein
VDAERESSVVGGSVKPREACRTCGLRIPLDRIVAVGHRRVLVCTRCHSTDAWEIDLTR